MDQSAQFGGKALAFFLVLIAGFFDKEFGQDIRRCFRGGKSTGLWRDSSPLLYVVLVLLVILLFDIMQVSLAPLVAILGAVAGAPLAKGQPEQPPTASDYRNQA